MTDLTPRDHDDLEVQMRIAKFLLDGLSVEPVRTPGQQGEDVWLRFSLNNRIPDADERAEMLRSYEAALREIMPVMHERLSIPLNLQSEEIRLFYEHDMEEMLQQAMRHVRAIFEGTHKWSPRLAQRVLAPEEESQFPVVDGCNLALHTLRDPATGVVTFGFIFVALLFDRSAFAEGAERILPLDADPLPEGAQPRI